MLKSFIAPPFGGSARFLIFNKNYKNNKRQGALLQSRERVGSTAIYKYFRVVKDFISNPLDNIKQKFS